MPMLALLMVTILGMAAFAIDGSNIYSQHRKLQADLDVAIKVAASEMWDFNPSSPSYTTTVRTAISDAARLLANDGYGNSLTITSSAGIAPINGDYTQGFCGTDSAAGITICNPPRTGLFAGTPHFDYVEGQLSRDVGGFFGGVLNLGTLHASVRAVAWHGGFHEPYALIGLDPNSGTCSVNSTGNANLTVDGSIVGDALTCGGSDPTVTGHSDEVGGGNSDQIVGQSGMNQYVPSVTDPFSSTGAITLTEAVTEVDSGGASTIPPQCDAEVQHYLGIDPSTFPTLPTTIVYFPPADGAVGSYSPPNPGGNYTYDFLPLCDGTATGQPGVYYITSKFQTAAGDYVNSFNSVFIFNSAISAPSPLLKNVGHATWALSAPTSGRYQGIALTQSRDGPEPPCPSGSTNYSYTNKIDFAGTGTFSTNGSVDLPCTYLYSSGHAGSGSSVPVTINGVLVTWQVDTSGDTKYTVTYNPDGTPADKGSVLVE